MYACTCSQHTFSDLVSGGGPGKTSGLVCPSFLPSMHPDGVGFFLPGSSLPSASTQKSPARPSHLSSPHVLCLFGVSIITQHFIPCVLLLKGKFPKGGSFPVPLTCYRLCQEACLTEVKLSKILLGERDVKLGQTSIGNGLVAWFGLCIPSSFNDAVSIPACYLNTLCAPPSCNNDPHLQ